MYEALHQVSLTREELYEISDALCAQFRRYIETGDPENHEITYRSVSHTLSAIRKICAELVGPDSPSWMGEFEERLTELRQAKGLEWRVRA